jgi:hypothetical protein
MKSVQDFIDLLADHEKKVGQLYRIYAQTFTETASFWTELSDEENRHAELLIELGDKIKEKHAHLDQNKFKSVIIHRSIEYVTAQIERVRSEPLKLKQALSIGLDIEKNIIDGQIFEIFKGYTIRAREIIRELGDAVLDHYRRIEKMWQENRYS